MEGSEQRFYLKTNPVWASFIVWNEIWSMFLQWWNYAANTLLVSGSSCLVPHPFRWNLQLIWGLGSAASQRLAAGCMVNDWVLIDWPHSLSANQSMTWAWSEGISRGGETLYLCSVCCWPADGVSGSSCLRLYLPPASSLALLFEGPVEQTFVPPSCFGSNTLTFFLLAPLWELSHLLVFLSLQSAEVNISLTVALKCIKILRSGFGFPISL